MGAMGLPPRFPCWCRATYSWGGETKKDLGFIEGDLIEALNAGDGSWWTGRLRRDPRAIGIFPSNFVKVLDEGFQPAPNSRNASPLTLQNKGGTTPTSSKSVFRKPFQAYEKLGPRGSLDNSREGTPESDKEKPKKKSKFTPYSSMKTAQAPMSSLRKQGSTSPLKNDSFPRIPEPLPRRSSRALVPVSTPTRIGSSASASPSPGHTPTAWSKGSYRAASPQPHYRTHSPAFSRPRSPLPATYHDGSAYPQMLPLSRQPSPSPYDQDQQDLHSRAHSPQPPFDYPRHASPTMFDDDSSSSPPPPPPPAHRVPYQPRQAPSPQPHHYSPDAYGTHRQSTTPVPPSPGDGHNMTPSPLRDAMNDVMSSLHDMSIDSDANEHERNRQQLNSPAPNIWSPDEYELVRNQSHRQHRQQLPEPVDDNHALPVNRVSSSPPFQDAQTKLSDYVQRMEQELGHAQSEDVYTSEDPPQPPLKGAQYTAYRPATSDSQSSQGYSAGYDVRPQQNEPKLQHRKSNFELGRTYTTKTNVTNSTSSSSATNTSNSTQLTSRSIMSGYSAGGFSATSAGSLARHKFGLGSQRGHSRTMSAVDLRESGAFGAANIRNTLASESSGSGPSYHESHASDNFTPTAPTADWAKDSVESSGVFGGLSAPKARRSGFFRKMIDNAKTTARTGAASARSTIGSASSSRPGSRAGSPTKSLFGGNGSGGIVGGTLSRPGSAYGGGPSKDTAAGSGVDWMQVRRDINRSNTISQREREDRMERCEMMERSALNPIDLFNELAEGDEGLDGIPVTDPIDFNTSNLALVDKSTRFIQSIPAMVSASTLAQNYICRPHRTDVQRLRAIFIWIAERITWEEDFEGQIDTKRVLQTRRGCNEEIAVVVRDMCNAVGLHAEVVRGYLKAPGEALALDTIAHPNHFWNAVIVDG
nr:cytokinesis protein 3 [Quercus suber]